VAAKERNICLTALQPQIAAVYNLNSNSWKYFPMTDSPFCSGHIQLINDQILIVGGDNLNLNEDFVDGRFNVRVFTGGANPSYQIVAQMQPFFPENIDPASGARWYPSLATMVDGNVLIVSGSTTEGSLSYSTQCTSCASCLPKE
jgi:hypothetical protein